MCDYVRAEHLTHEATEELEDDAVVMQMAGLVGAGVVVMAKCAIMAFSMNHHLDLVSWHRWLASVG